VYCAAPTGAAVSNGFVDPSLCRGVVSSGRCSVFHALLDQRQVPGSCGSADIRQPASEGLRPFANDWSIKVSLVLLLSICRSRDLVHWGRCTKSPTCRRWKDSP